jgi:hypothetical protein
MSDRVRDRRPLAVTHRSACDEQTEFADELLLADLIAAEVVYVLESFYEAPRTQVAETMRAVLAFPAVRVIDADLQHRALEVYEVHGLDVME